MHEARGKRTFFCRSLLLPRQTQRSHPPLPSKTPFPQCDTKHCYLPSQPLELGKAGVQVREAAGCHHNPGRSRPEPRPKLQHFESSFPDCFESRQNEDEAGRLVRTHRKNNFRPCSLVFSPPGPLVIPWNFLAERLFVSATSHAKIRFACRASPIH